MIARASQHTQYVTRASELPGAVEKRLPARVQTPGGPLICAAYHISCVPGSRPARGALGLAAEDEAEEAARGGCAEDTDTATPLLPRGAPPGGSCASVRSAYVATQCSPTLLVPEGAAGGSSNAADAQPPIDVLLATSDHRGHGLFATVERVLNQILFAQEKGLVPYVWLGPLIFAPSRSCGAAGMQPYYSVRAAQNVWEHWFDQPSAWRLGASTLSGRRVRSVQVVSPESLYHAGGVSPNRRFVQTYLGARSYRHAVTALAHHRAAAHAALANGSLVRAPLRRKAAAISRAWRVCSGHVIGVHVRGTDKVPLPPARATRARGDGTIGAHP